jgi:hypothetical protein
VDEVLHCRELLKGIPFLRSVRFYLDAHRSQLGAAQADCAVLIDRFTNELRGRPKYLAEAKRNLELLAESIGKLKPAAVDVNRIDDFPAQFNSDWSHAIAEVCRAGVHAIQSTEVFQAVTSIRKC